MKSPQINSSSEIPALYRTRGADVVRVLEETP
jgi:hypothetical protein